MSNLVLLAIESHYRELGYETDDHYYNLTISNQQHGLAKITINHYESRPHEVEIWYGPKNHIYSKHTIILISDPNLFNTITNLLGPPNQEP